MAEPHHHDHTPASDSGGILGLLRRSHRRLTLIILVKLALVALLLALPTGLAISMGVGHGVILLVILVVGGPALVIHRRRRSRMPQPGTAHRPPHGH